MQSIDASASSAAVGSRPAATEAAILRAGHDLAALADVVRHAFAPRQDLAVYLAVAEFGGEHLRIAAWSLPDGTDLGPPPSDLITVDATDLGQAFAAVRSFVTRPDPERLVRSLQGRFRTLVQRHPLRHVVAVPICIGHRAVGMLGLSNTTGDLPVSDEERLRAIADRIAVPVAHARLISAAARADRKQHALAVLAEQAFTAPAPAALFDLVTTTVCAALEADICGILTVTADGSTAHLVAAVGVDPSVADVMIPMSDPFMQRVVAKRAGLRLVDEVPADATRTLAHRMFGIGSSLSVGVRRGEEVVAILGVGRHDPLLFSETDAAFLGSVASIVANALDVRATHDILRLQASTDDLTGLPNRTLMASRIDEAIADAARHGTSVSFLLADLDGFKVLNDSLGHRAGDEVLKAVAARLAATVGPRDTLARLGGDEFAVLCPGIEEEDAVALAERLLAAVAQPVPVEGTEVVPRASIGVALHRGGGAGSPRATGRDLLPQADLAMYRAKAGGRQRVAVYDAGMQEDIDQRLAIEQGLRAAIGTDQLHLHYQPLVSRVTGGICGLEALIRWRHPTLGMVPPDRFIAVAEESELICSVTNWVVGEAARQTVAWRRSGLLDTCRISVNLSARDLTEPTFVDRFQAILAEAGCEPWWLTVEVTETLLTEAAGAAATLALRELGVIVALDDYGTGFSSLGQLKRLPVQGVKIDRGFVANMLDDMVDQVMVESTIRLSHALGLYVVAEGVETVDQLAMLDRFGCDVVQGYLFSPPRPADVVAGQLADGLPGFGTVPVGR